MKNNLFFKVSVAISLASIGTFAANLDEGNYFIKSMHSGECLQIDTSISNAKLVQSKCDYTNDMQKFKITNIENSIYYISNLAVGNKSKDNGVHLFNSSTPDEFRLIPNTANSAFNVKSTRSNKLLTLIPYTNEVIQYYDHGSKEQFWKFINEDAGKIFYSSCKEILDADKSIGDGDYTIDIDGEGGASPISVYCDMTTDGGGWTVYNFRKYATYNDMASSQELVNYSTYDPVSGHTYHPEKSFLQNSTYGLRWGYNTPTYRGEAESITFNTPKFSEIRFKGGLPKYESDWGELNIYGYNSNDWVNIRLNVNKNACHQWSTGMYWTSSNNSEKNYELENGLSGGCRGIGIKEHYIQTQFILNSIKLGLGGYHMGPSRQTQAYIDYIKVR